MSKQVRQYTNEFKLQAVDLAKQLQSAAKAGRELGIPISTIHGFLRQFNNKGLVKDLEANGFSEKEELRILRKENAEQKKVIHILKSAAAFFSQDHLK
jgi:transposase-like protein